MEDWGMEKKEALIPYRAAEFRQLQTQTLQIMLSWLISVQLYPPH
jgi:hypothetical protein